MEQQINLEALRQSAKKEIDSLKPISLGRRKSLIDGINTVLSQNNPTNLKIDFLTGKVDNSQKQGMIEIKETKDKYIVIKYI